MLIRSRPSIEKVLFLLQINVHQSFFRIIVSQIIEFLFWGSKLAKFLAQNQGFFFHFAKILNAMPIRIGHDFRK